MLKLYIDFQNAMDIATTPQGVIDALTTFSDDLLSFTEALGELADVAQAQVDDFNDGWVPDDELGNDPNECALEQLTYDLEDAIEEFLADHAT